ncbi:MAG: HAD-IA family hydrolase [Clostridia bacterium]|nr:HAD-IA family hydrolase [Clostridia bacterium]
MVIYKAVIFDLDGTLLDTLGDLHAAVNHALRAFGFPERSIDEVRRFIGNGVVKLMQRATPENTDEETDRKCLDAFRKYYLIHMRDKTAPYDGVIALLEKLRAKGIKTAVVSNKFHQAVYELCLDYFPGLIDEAFGVSVESERKPSPANVYKALEKTGVTADECIYIGDSEVDVQTSHNAGIKCIGVTWGFRDRAELEKAGADIICDSCDDILKQIVD